MLKRIAVFILFSFSFTHFLYPKESEKMIKEQFIRQVGPSKKHIQSTDSSVIKLNSFRTSIKVDAVKGMQLRPRIAFEVFWNNKVSLELGFGTFWNDRKIYNNIYIHQGTNPYWYMGYGPAKGYDGYFEVKRSIKGKHSMNKSIRFINHIGIGFYYRYSHFDKTYQIYEIREGDDHYSTCLQSEISKIYCIKLTYDANIKAKSWKHFYLNPYISVMPGISYSNIIIEKISSHNGNLPTTYSTGSDSFNKTIYTAFKEIGLKLCWGMGRN